MGRHIGISAEKLAALGDFETSGLFDERERLALRLSEAMTRTPAEVPEELFEALRAHFDPRQLVELTAAIAWENFRARFNRPFGIEAEGFSEGAACALPASRRQDSGPAGRDLQG